MGWGWQHSFFFFCPWHSRVPPPITALPPTPPPKPQPPIASNVEGTFNCSERLGSGVGLATDLSGPWAGVGWARLGLNWGISVCAPPRGNSLRCLCHSAKNPSLGSAKGRRWEHEGPCWLSLTLPDVHSTQPLPTPHPTPRQGLE